MFLQIQSSKVHFFKEHTLQSRFIQKFTKTAPMIYVNKMGLKDNLDTLIWAQALGRLIARKWRQLYEIVSADVVGQSVETSLTNSFSKAKFEILSKNFIL